jgi:hypothetical protein
VNAATEIKTPAPEQPHTAQDRPGTRPVDGSPGGGGPSGASYAPLSGSPPPASDLAPPEADAFYADSLRILSRSKIPFLVAGTFAVNCYTGINRATKDLDIFCKAGDFPRIFCISRSAASTPRSRTSAGSPRCAAATASSM